jgi:hypothetical protein
LVENAKQMNACKENANLLVGKKEKKNSPV